MNRTRLSAVLVALLGLVPALTFAGIKNADIDSTGPSFTIKPWHCHIQGQLTADVTGKCKGKNYEKWMVVSTQAVCRARSGAASDATFDITAGGTSILTAKFAVDTAGTVYPTSGTQLAGTPPVAIAAGTTISVDWDRNNSGTADDCDITIFYRCPVAAETQ